MRSLIKIGALVVLCGLLVFLGTKVLFTQESAQTKSPQSVQQETYVTKVIISAPYAKKSLVYGKEESPTGEFGYHVDEETSVGPSTFTVAPNGDIYIADPLNNRIQRFNSEGIFLSTISAQIRPVDMCIDQNNNIYFLRYGWKPEQLGSRKGTVGAVLKCDQKGNIEKTYPVYTGVGATANFVYCDKFGRIFYAYPWSRGGAGFYQVGTSDQAFSLAQQKNSTKNGWLGFNSIALDKNLFFQPDALRSETGYGNLHLVNFDGDTLKVFKSITGEFFGFDQDLNIFVLGDRWFRVYDPKGTLIDELKCGCERPYTVVEGRARNRTLDEKGNLYILCENWEEGIRVIKCYKQ